MNSAPMLLSALSLVALASACGVGVSNDRGSSSVTSISIGLPDRAGLKTKVPDIETKMNAYRLVVTPVDATCANATKVDEIGDYAAAAKVGASLVQGCDYDVTLELGHKADVSATPTPTPSPTATPSPSSTPTPTPTPSPTPTASPTPSPTPSPSPSTSSVVTYYGEAKSVFDRACVSCHSAGITTPDLTTYAGVKAQGALILSSVESQRMPVGSALSRADKDTLKAWARGNFAEGAPAVDATPTPTAGLEATYYANAAAKRILKADIDGKAEYKSGITLDLTAAGRALGLE